MIYHFFSESLTTPVIVKFLHHHQADFAVEQRFVITTYKDLRFRKDSNVQYYDKKGCLIDYTAKAFLEIFKKETFMPNDKVVIHGFFNNYLMEFLSMNPHLIEQCIWCVWGGDLYSDPEEIQRIADKKLFYKIAEMKKKIYPKIKIVCQGRTAEVIRKIYGNDVSFLSRYAMYYPNPLEIGDYEKSERCKDEIVFLVGNSGTPSNYHEEAFNELERFRNKNMKIIVPLSYGEEAYIQKIASIGKQKFGTNFIPLLDVQSPKEYIDTLGSVHVALFNHRRQQAGGTIRALCLMKKKFYFRSDNPGFKQCLNDGLNLYDICRLSQQTWEELISYDEIKLEKNAKIMRDIYDEEKMVKLWKKIMR